MRDLPAELRLGDVITFFAVRRRGSLSGAARELGVTVSQVSKAVARLEAQLHLPLVSRSIQGVTLTDGALRVLPHLEKMVESVRDVMAPQAQSTPTLTLAAPSYVLALLLPAIAEAVPHVRFAGVEVPPALLRAQAGANLYDLSVMVGRARLPESWQSVPVGGIRKGLLARPQLARQLRPSPVKPEALLEVPFITPVYLVNGQFAPVDDDCPLTPSERRAGHQVQTLAVALELASCIDQLVYGPVMAAWRFLQAGLLTEVQVKGWRSLETLYLACNRERLLARDHRAIVLAVQRRLEALAQLDPTAPRAGAR